MLLRIRFSTLIFVPSSALFIFCAGGRDVYLFILIMLLDKNRDYPFFCCNIGPFCCKDHSWSLLLLFLLLLTVCFVASAAAVYKLLFADHVVTFNAFV